MKQLIQKQIKLQQEFGKNLAFLISIAIFMFHSEFTWKFIAQFPNFENFSSYLYATFI